MRGYLRNGESVFVLSPKVTIIGSESCGLIIQSADVDSQHAVIDFSEADNCFVLQDLNSTKGTYINDCRIQNTAVRLTAGDVIRFGMLGPSYRFLIDSPTQPLSPGESQSSVYAQCPGLPPLRSGVSPVQAWEQIPAPVQPPYNVPTPHPPTTARSARPVSAGSRRISDRSMSSGRAQQVSTPPMTRYGGGYIPLASGDPTQTRNLKPDMSSCDELKTRLSCIREEIRRMASFESDYAQRADQLAGLYDEVTALQTQLRLATDRHRSQSAHTRDCHETVTPINPSVWKAPKQPQPQLQQIQPTTRLLPTSRQLLTEVHSIPNQAAQVGHMYGPSPATASVPSRDPGQQFPDSTGMWQELEQLKREKSAANEFVARLQAELANKDIFIRSVSEELESMKSEVLAKNSYVSSISGEIDKYKTEIAEKESRISSLSADLEELRRVAAHKDAELSSLKESNAENMQKLDNEKQTQEREILLLNHKVKTTEARTEELNETVRLLKEELAKLRQADIIQQEVNRKLSAENVLLKESSRSERGKQTDLEQQLARLEQLKCRVTQVAFQGSDGWENNQISDDGLVSTLRIYMFERLDLQKKIKELEAQQSDREKMVSGSKRMAHQLSEIITGLDGSKLLSEKQLKTKLNEVNELHFAGNEMSCLLHNLTTKLLSTMLSWQRSLEAAIEEAGVTVAVDDDHLQAVKDHIAGLNASVKAASEARDEWQMKCVAATMQHQIVLDSSLKDIQQRLEDRHREDVQKLNIQHETSLKEAVEKALESQDAVHQQSLSSLQADITALQQKCDSFLQTLGNREQEIETCKKEVQKQVAELEQQKQKEVELSARLTKSQQEKQAEVAELNEQLSVLRAQFNKDVADREVLLQQHAATICTLEDRLNETINKNRDSQVEISALKNTIAELNERLLQPPKPKMIIQKPVVDVAMLERTIADLERTKTDSSQQIQQQNDIITALKRELATTLARLSDVTGEINEKTKLDLEKSQKKTQEQQAELTDLRGKLSSLSQAVDQQTASVQKLKAEISKHESAVKTYADKLKESDAKNKDLEKALLSVNNTDEQKKESLLIEEERAKAELLSLGAQCKGDRHDQVILRQREALMELRTRIRDLEKLASGSGQTPDLALQQVLLLQQQYGMLEESEMAASVSANGTELTQVDRAVNMARGLRSRMDIDMQLGILRDSQLALELSETTYLALLRAIATALESCDIQGHQSMAHTPSGERDQLVEIRTTSSNLLVEKIKALKDRIVAKDQMLLEYQQDLAKHDEALRFAEECSLKAESLNLENRKLVEETQYLREMLARNRDDCERERRLNEAIKQKKTYHLENEQLQKNGWPKHACVAPDPADKVSGKKKIQVRCRSVDVKVTADSLKVSGKPGDNVRFAVVAADS